MKKEEIMIRAVLSIILGILEFLLALRIILIFLRIPAQYPLVSWVINITDPIVAPFVGLLPSPFVVAGFPLDLNAVIALVVVSIIYMIMVRLTPV
jgi:uncharacterized protein YggT (Ycf19 family)